MTSTPALYVTSGSMSLMSTFVALNMSTVWFIAFPNGDSCCSYISSLLRYSSNCCFTGSAMFFDWILAISLTAISYILRSTGSMLPSTSIASLPDVAGNPKHIDYPFLLIASNFFMFSVGVICQTGQPYSMIDLTRLVYILSSFVLEMFAKPFISLIIWMEMLVFLST